MGWVFSIALLIVGGITGNSSYVIAAGLFAIAGSVSFLANENEED